MAWRMTVFISIWLVSFALSVWLERSKLARIKKHVGWSMVVLLVVSSLTLGPMLLGQLLVERLLSRVHEDGKAPNRLR